MTTSEPNPAQRKRLFLIIVVGVLLILFFLPIKLPGGKEKQAADQVRAQKAELDLRSLSLLIDMFHTDHQRYPTGFDELTTEINGRTYLDDLPLDPFTESPYRWETVDGRPSLVSYGADGTPGGEGVDADLRSKKLER